MFKENDTLKSVSTQISSFIASSSKVSDYRSFLAIPFKGKDRKIQAMIYEEQLHYKSQHVQHTQGTSYN